MWGFENYSEGLWDRVVQAPAVSTDGTVYFTAPWYVNTDCGALYAFDGTSGEIKWRYEIEAPTQRGWLIQTAPLVGIDGTAFVAIGKQNGTVGTGVVLFAFAGSGGPTAAGAAQGPTPSSAEPLGQALGPAVEV